MAAGRAEAEVIPSLPDRGNARVGNRYPLPPLLYNLLTIKVLV